MKYVEGGIKSKSLVLYDQQLNQLNRLTPSLQSVSSNEKNFTYSSKLISKNSEHLQIDVEEPKIELKLHSRSVLHVVYQA